MRGFLEQYGVGIFTLVMMAILIAMAGPFGIRIKEYTLAQLDYSSKIADDEIYDATNNTKRPDEPETSVDKVYCYIDKNYELVISQEKIVPPADAIATSDVPLSKPKSIDTTSGKSLIHSVRFEGAIKTTSCANWFGDQWDRTNSCQYLTEVKNMQNLYTTNTTEMFAYCNQLSKIDVRNFDTSKLTNAGYMFSYCSSLTSLDVHKWDTSNIKYFSQIFNGCTKLTTLTGIDKWNVSSVTYMPDMFRDCSSLTTLNLSGWKTNPDNLVGIGYMFYGCTRLETLKLNNFAIGSETNYYGMFENCNSLKTITCNTDTQTKLSSVKPSGTTFVNS